MVIFLAVKLKSHGFFSCHKITTKPEQFSRHQLKTLGIEEEWVFFFCICWTQHHTTTYIAVLSVFASLPWKTHHSISI